LASIVLYAKRESVGPVVKTEERRKKEEVRRKKTQDKRPEVKETEVEGGKSQKKQR